MWFILLVAACVMAIPIAFEVHYKGPDNILARSGKEFIESRVLRRVRGLLGALGASAVIVGVLVVGWFFIVFAWTFLAWLLHLVF